MNDGATVEQQSDQQIEHRPKQLGGHTGKGFMPGVSGNPAGRRRRKDRIAGHVQALVVEFCAKFDRTPTTSETILIASVALNISNQESMPADSERSGKLSKEIRRDLQSLGLAVAPTRAAPAPMPSGRDLIKRGSE